MSQFYDQASLVMVPSGYKNGKVYSQKPLSTDGELTFSRASNATRVNSSGLVEKVRENLVLQSETFDNASWNKSLDGQVTITANAATAPNGTTTADKIIPSAIAGFHCVQQQVTLSAGEVSISIYAKAAENSFIQLFDALTTDYVNFNLTTGVVGSSDVYVGSIESVGNGYYRCKATKVVPSGTFSVRVGVVTSATAARGESFTGNGTDGILIWGAQLEYGVPTDYIATTSSAVSVGPVSGLPRLDYSGGASCPSLKLEPQRTNQILQSESFGSASWSVFNASIQSNVSATLDPQGYYGADKLVEDSSSAFHDVDQVQTYTAAPHTISVFAKSAGRDHIFLQHFDGVTFFTSGTFNLANGTVSGSGSIEAYSNGWYRCSFTATTASGTGKSYINLSNGTSGNYAGNGTDGVYLWGAMLEQGSYSSSYLPTLSTAVTRVDELANKLSIGSLIGGTSGTIFYEIHTNKNMSTASFKQLFYYTDASASQMYMYVNNGQSVVTNLYLGSMTSSITLANDTTYKIAVAYAPSDYKMYINGVEVGSSTSGTPLDLVNIFSIGSYNGTSEFNEFSFKQILHFKTRLSNADLATLTTI